MHGELVKRSNSPPTRVSPLQRGDMGDYKKLRVWQEACEFADKIEEYVDRLPAPIRTRHGDQLCRASSSIHENIAEGCGLNSDRQLLKFLRQALGSANESEDELLALQRRCSGHTLRRCF